jgi:cytochrome c
LSDCKACHAADKKSIGPSYLDLGKKYKPSAQNIDMLAKKIINGGGGVWGEQAMAAHPQISLGDAKEIVNYVLSLSDKKKASKPVVGEYIPQDKGKAGTYLFAASYTDKGAGKLGPATGQKVVALRNPTIKAVDFDQVSKGSKYKVDGLGEVLAATGDKGRNPSIDGSRLQTDTFDQRTSSAGSGLTFSEIGQSGAGGRIETSHRHC